MPNSFIEVSADSHFPIQNLPYGVFSRKSVSEAKPSVGVAIGDYVMDMKVLFEEKLIYSSHLSNNVFAQSSLNAFMAAGKKARIEVREQLLNLLAHDNVTLRDNQALRDKVFVSMSDTQMHMPAEIGDYTDFYSSREHATNVGMMFRDKDNALLPNWLHVPVGYHGRASSVVLSGTNIYRPHGQTKAPDADKPSFGPSKRMDFELEMGYFVSKGNDLGESVSVKNAKDHLFGMVLVNDWSARDIQVWEYVPLGPFLAKNLGTSISPWVVTMEALEPFRVEGPKQDPEPFPYLQHEAKSGYDVQLEVTIQTEKMDMPYVISRSNLKYMYWSAFQHLAHHTIGGCNMKTADLMATGTISGPTEDSYGSLLELAWKGTKPVKLPSGEERSFLQDGDTLSLTGFCQGDGYRVGFGEVSGTILPAKDPNI